MIEDMITEDMITEDVVSVDLLVVDIGREEKLSELSKLFDERDSAVDCEE